MGYSPQCHKESDMTEHTQNNKKNTRIKINDDSVRRVDGGISQYQFGHSMK